MMTLQAIAEEIRSMPVKQRKQLMMIILDSLTNDQPAKTHSVLEFRGVGAHLRDMN